MPSRWTFRGRDAEQVLVLQIGCDRSRRLDRRAIVARPDHTPAGRGRELVEQRGLARPDGDGVHQRVASTHGVERVATRGLIVAVLAVGEEHDRAPAWPAVDRAGRPANGIDNRRRTPRRETPHGLARGFPRRVGRRDGLDVAAHREDVHAIAGAERLEESERAGTSRGKTRASHAEAVIDDDRHRERKRACGKRGNRAVDAVVAHAERLSSQAVQRVSRGVGHGDVDLDEIRAGRKLRGARKGHETTADRKGQRGQPSRPMHEVGATIAGRSYPMGSLGFPELVVILVIVILIFGANRLPEIGRGIGKGIRNFKDATRESCSRPWCRSVRRGWLP